MKKLAVITILFIIVAGLGIAECVWCDKYYTEVCELLDEAHELLTETPEDSVCEDAGQILEHVMQSFASLAVGLLGNTNVTEKVSEFAAQALAYSRAGQNADACSAILGARRAAERLARESMPHLANIF